MSKTIGDNIKAARNAWEASNRSVPFPDYWQGWLAATKLIDAQCRAIVTAIAGLQV